MIAKITPTDEQRLVLQTASEATVVLVDSLGAATHLVLPIDDAKRMLDERLGLDLQIGFVQAMAGEVVDWDPERIKAEGRRRLAERAARDP